MAQAELDASNEAPVTAPLGNLESTPNSSVVPLRADSLQATGLIEKYASKSHVALMQANSDVQSQPVLDVEPQHASEISEIPGFTLQVDSTYVLNDPQHSPEITEVGSTPGTVDSQHSSGHNQTNRGGSSSGNIAACCPTAIVQAATRIVPMATEMNATCFCLVMTFLAGLLVLALSPIIWPKTFGL